MIRSERGSYSLYFMIILSALLLFFGTLIDFARVKLVEHQAEAAVQAAVRSGLSYFDEDLHRFGLYAMESVEKSIEIASYGAMRHLSAGNGFSLTSSVLKDFTFTIDQRNHLGNHLIFKNQLLEEMKYKAPIEFSLAVIDKFQNTDISKQMHAATAVHKKLEELEQLRIKREEALDRSSDKIEDWLSPTGSVQAVNQYYKQTLHELQQLAENIQDVTKEEATETITILESEWFLLETNVKDVKRERESAAERLNEHLREEQANQDENWNDLRKELETMLDELDAEINRLEELLNDLESEIETWKQIIQDIETFELKMEEVIERLDQDLSDMRGSFSLWQQTFNEAAQTNAQMRRVLEQAVSKGTLDSEVLASLQEDFTIEPSFFYEHREDAATTTSLFQSFVYSWNETLVSAPRTFLDQKSGLMELNERYAKAAFDMYQKYKPWDTLRIQQNRQIENEQKSTIRKLSRQLDELKQWFASCEGSPSYEELKQKEQKYGQLNAVDSTETSADSIQLKDAAEMPDEAIGVLGVLQKAIVTVRNRAYVNEYALMHFNYRTYGDENDHSAAVRSNPNQRILKNQEAEYILYGFGSCELNQTAAFVEIFTLRMGIRTMEALLDSKSAVRAASPWLAFLLAALEGAVKAFEDVRVLIAGDEVPLSAKLSDSITLNYKDYLRLFMLVHGNEVKMLSRMQALIEWNTGKVLHTKYTYADAEMSMHTSLWFLPGNKREIVRQASFSY